MTRSGHADYVKELFYILNIYWKIKCFGEAHSSRATVRVFIVPREGMDWCVGRNNAPSEWVGSKISYLQILWYVGLFAYFLHALEMAERSFKSIYVPWFFLILGQVFPTVRWTMRVNLGHWIGTPFSRESNLSSFWALAFLLDLGPSSDFPAPSDGRTGEICTIESRPPF